MLGLHCRLNPKYQTRSEVADTHEHGSLSMTAVFFIEPALVCISAKFHQVGKYFIKIDNLLFNISDRFALLYVSLRWDLGVRLRCPLTDKLSHIRNRPRTIFLVMCDPSMNEL
jgi:hypothetical protein